MRTFQTVEIGPRGQVPPIHPQLARGGCLHAAHHACLQVHQVQHHPFPGPGGEGHREVRVEGVGHHRHARRLRAAGHRGARRPGATPSKLKAFKEKNHAHLQALQEAVVFLMASASDEETWQSIRMSMTSINETAQALDFPVIAEYAGTLEEIAERVLRNLFKVTSEVVAVFTRVAPVLTGMMHDDPLALQEARQHQAKLQRLADEYRHARTAERNAPAPAGLLAERPVGLSPQDKANTPQKPGNSAPGLQLPGRRAQADDEVMAYFKGRFAGHKKN